MSNNDEINMPNEKLYNLEIEEKSKATEIEQIIVNYCDICRFPQEYCEYTHKIFEKGINNMNIQQTKTETKTTEGKPEKQGGEEEKPKTDIITESKEATENAKKDKKDKKSDNKKIDIKVSKRGTRKFATHVFNLELFNLNLKDVAKMFSKKFACSSTVSKENNKDCIVLTGEFTYEIVDFLKEKFPNIITDENCHISEAK
jgi:density-regulated protein DRP1